MRLTVHIRFLIRGHKTQLDLAKDGRSNESDFLDQGEISTKISLRKTVQMLGVGNNLNVGEKEFRNWVQMGKA